MTYLPLALVMSSLVAFAFFGYTLMNLERLGIRPTHPRVLVEAGLGLSFLAAAYLLWR